MNDGVLDRQVESGLCGFNLVQVLGQVLDRLLLLLPVAASVAARDLLFLT